MHSHRAIYVIELNVTINKTHYRNSLSFPALEITALTFPHISRFFINMGTLEGMNKEKHSLCITENGCNVTGIIKGERDEEIDKE